MKTPDKIIIQSSEQYEELLPEKESFEDWYQACKSTWNQNLNQGDVLFIQLAFMEENVKYLEEAFVVPFVPTSGLSELITDWLEQ